MKTSALPSATHRVPLAPLPVRARRRGTRQSDARRAAALFFATLLATPWGALAQSINLGTAANLTILGGTTVTNTGPTMISGNVGVSPGTGITGFPPGIVTGGALHANDGLAMQGKLDAAAAYGQIAGETPTFELSGQDLGGLTLVPGVYHFATDAELTGTLRLNTMGDPNAVFHFQIGTALNTATASQILLLGLNGAAATNVFWQVGSSAALGLGSTFDGTLLAFTSITLTTGTVLDGRALALNGAVTLDTNRVTGPAAAIATGAVWNGGASNRWSGTNWSPTVTGATTSTLAPNANVVFSVTGIAPKNQNTILDYDATIASLTVNDPAAVTISGSNTLTIDGTGVNGGITVNSGAGPVTINSNLALAGQSQVMTVNNAAGLAINGVISGAVGFTKIGAGTLTLGRANTYSGATALLQGTVVANAFYVIPSGSALLVNAGARFDLHTTLQSIGSLADGPNGGGAILLEGSLDIGNDNTDTFFSGVISGSGGLAKVGSGTQILAGANTYTGGTAIVAGTLQAGAAHVIPGGGRVPVTMGSVFNLDGFDQSVGSLMGGVGGGGGEITLGGARLTIGNDTDKANARFSGVISGRGALKKVGLNTQTLLGANTYDGATVIAAGTLEAGATDVLPKSSPVAVHVEGLLKLNGFDQSIGSLAGAGAVELAGASLVTGNDNRSTLFSGVISGPGAVEKVGSGTWELTGRNAFIGRTTLSAGTLALESTIGGKVLVLGGTLRGIGTVGGNVFNAAAVNPGRVDAPGTLHVGGGFTQAPSGELNIRLASPTSYDRMGIGDASKLGGALNVTYLDGFEAEVGDKFTVLTSGGGVSGRFASFDDAHARGTLLSLEVSYERNAVVLEFAQGSFADLPFDLTPNQLAVGEGLDELAGDHPGSKLIEKLDSLKLSELPEAYSLLSGEDLGTIFTSGLAISQVQLGNIEHRLSEVRQGSAGFSDSGFAVTDSRGTRNYDGKSAVSADGKGVVNADGKESTELVEADAERDRRWGFFISGTGAWGDVESTSEARGSSFTTGGVTVGADYRVNRHLVVGAAIGYANTSTELSRGGSLDFDGGKASLYATAYTGGFYVNGIVGAGYGSIETRRRTLGGFAHGDTDATDFSALLGTGYDFHLGAFTVGPVASIQYGTVGIDSFTEHGALGALRVDAQSQDSLKSAVGMRASYTKKVGRVVLRPEIRAQWQHEYLDDESSIDGGFASRNSFTVHGPETGRDALLLDAGISAQLTPSLSIFAFYTGELGRENYTVHSVTGGLGVSF